jgi:hypothetical protein
VRTYDELSLAEKVAKFPQDKRDQIFAGYTQDDYASLDFDWNFWGRPEQLAPPGNWDNWLILAGRGFGKTRTGAEWVRANMCGDTPLTGGRWSHVALIAETAADARDVMVGDGRMLSDSSAGSGILQIHPKDYRPIYEPSKRRLTWPNGAIATLYNAVEPDQLRGPQHAAAWCDELAKWRYAQDTWDQLQFGLRLADNPQTCSRGRFCHSRTSSKTRAPLSREARRLTTPRTLPRNCGGQDFVGHDVILVGAESDPMLATVYRIALVIALEEFFACVQIFGTELALAKYCQKKWPGGRIDQAVADLVRGLN